MNRHNDYIEPLYTSDKLKDTWDRTKEIGHHIADTTREVISGETPVERHEKKIEREQEKLANESLKHRDDPQKINKETDKRAKNIMKEENKLTNDINSGSNYKIIY